MHNRLLILILSVGVTELFADALKSGKYCFGGCELALGYVRFNGTAPNQSSKHYECSNKLRTTSLFLCFEQYCSEKDRHTWLQEKNETCWKVNSTLPPYEIVEDYPPEKLANVRRLSFNGSNIQPSPSLLTEVAIPSQHFFDIAFRTLDDAYSEYDIHWAYGVALYYYWAAVICFGICYRLFFLIQGLRRQGWQAVPSYDIDAESHRSNLHRRHPRRLYTLLKRYVIVPATFGFRCSQNVGWCTIPPRIQSLAIFTFLALNIIFCCVSYRVFEGSLYWPTISAQLWRYVSDRTGIVSIANFPLIWLFGTRNNVLIWLTGWEFGAYNNFHRWAARVATVQAVVHSIGYTQMVYSSGGWASFIKYLSKHYFWNGELATIFMVTICICSVYGLRRSHYEVFLVTHIALSILVLLTMYYHVYIFNGEYNRFIWPCVVIWLFDRALRGLRILAFSWQFWKTRATATYDHSSNLVRLSVALNRSFVVPTPGKYYYLYILDDLIYAHQNHPFTVAYISSTNRDEGPDKSLLISQKQIHDPRPLPHRSGSSSSTESDALLGHTPTSSVPPSHEDTNKQSLTFLIRPYDGLTSRLRAHALQNPTTSSKNIRILLEGPYGSNYPLHTFQKVVFIVGGTGIAVPLSYLSSLLSHTEHHSKNNGLTQIHIVWAVREHALLASVLEHDIAAHVLQDERLHLTVHVTQDEEIKDTISPSSSSRRNSTSEDAHGLGKVRLKAGRPRVEDAVREVVCREEMDGSERVAVVACGPAQMADQARRTCVKVLGEGHAGVEYFEESFKW